jgi:general secretion pathway protein F
MPQYQYQGFDAKGKNVRGVVHADNAAAAKSQLRRDGFFVSNLQEALLATEETGASSNPLSRFFRRIPVEDVSNMTRQLATLVAAHIPLVEALSALVDQVENPDLKAAIARVRADVNEGSTLHNALAKYPEVFSDLYVSMVASGEASGALDIVLLRLADFLEYQSRLRKKVMGAMLYPLGMIAFGAIAVLVIFTVVIPELEQVFSENKQQLPLMTRIVLVLSKFTVAYWWVMLAGLVIAAFAVARYFNSEIGRRQWDETKLKLPVFGDVFRMIAVSRFTKTLSTLLRSGIPLLPSLNVVKNVVNNITIKEAIEKATVNLTEGQGISGPLKRSGQFPPLVTHMVSVGERTGEIESMLERVADHYEYQVNNKVENFTALIEPIMIIILALIVLVIVLSVVLPMIELNNTAL